MISGWVVRVPANDGVDLYGPFANSAMASLWLAMAIDDALLRGKSSVMFTREPTDLFDPASLDEVE